MPLGRTDVVPPERAALVLSGFSPKRARYFGVDVRGVRLVATDADWAHGEGEPVHGRAADLLLLVSGRTVPAESLTGRGATRFGR